MKILNIAIALAVFIGACMLGSANMVESARFGMGYH